MKVADKIEIGSRISEELSDYLQKYTGGRERSEAAEKAQVSDQLIHSIVNRRRPMTAYSHTAIIELVKIAIAKCEEEGEQAEAGKEYMKSLLV